MPGAPLRSTRSLLQAAFIVSLNSVSHLDNMWHLSISAWLLLSLLDNAAGVPTPAQPKILRRLTPGANFVPLSRTNSITNLETGQFNETFCMAHMTYL